MTKPQLIAEMRAKYNDLRPYIKSGVVQEKIDEVFNWFATALEEERQEILREVEAWLDEMKKHDWGDLMNYEAHEVGIPKGYNRAVNELKAKLNQLKGSDEQRS